MAKTVKTTTEETIADGQEMKLSDETDSPSEAEQLRELLELGSDSVRWSVKRISPAEKAGHCTTYSTSELTLDRIREDWGHGRYNIRGIDGAGKYVGSKTVTIVEGVRRPSDNAGPAGGQDLAAIIAALKPQGDNNATMLAVMNMIQTSQKANTDMILAMINRPLPAAPTPPDPLAMIAALKDILKPDKSADSAIDTLLKGLELGKELGGGNGDWTDLVGKGITALGAISQPTETTTPIKQIVRLPAPGTVSAQSTASGQPSEQDPMLRILNWMNAQLRALLTQAAKQKDPELYAEVMLDNLPPYITSDFIFEKFSAPDALEQLIQFNADVAHYRPWFEAFRDAVINFLTPDQDDAEIINNETRGDPQLTE